MHLPIARNIFTWNNGKKARAPTKKRLDGFICNFDWINMYTYLSCNTLIKIKYDHYPIILTFKLDVFKFMSHFKFIQIWYLHINSHRVISQVWDTRIMGCPMYILDKKLKLLKTKYIELNKSCFGNVNLNVKNAEEDLKTIQASIESHNQTG